MFPSYDVTPNCGPLLQGELLTDIYEHRPLYPPMVAGKGTEIDYHPIHHRLMIIMNPACDLDWDFKARFPGGQLKEIDLAEVDSLSPLVPHVLLCDAYERAQIQSHLTGDDHWRRIRGNQVERYHYFPATPIGEPQVAELPDLYLDFKKTIALPCSGLYEALRQNGIKRIAAVPAVYLHNLVHRFYGFWSRVGLPTPSLIGYEIEPRSAKVGDTITFAYTISNANLTPWSVGLQASIRLPSGSFLDDPTNDIIVSVSPGISTIRRTYNIPAIATPGNYEVCWSIWSDAPGSSTRYEQASRPEYLTIELPTE